MTSPRRGLSFEQALEHYSPPGDYAAMKRLQKLAPPIPIIILGEPPNPNEVAYNQLRGRLEKALFERLAEAQLLSSATEKEPDPVNPRFMVHPSLFDGPDVYYVEFTTSVRAQNRELWNVEIFEPDAVPRTVCSVPLWLAQLTTSHVHMETDSEAAPSHEHLRRRFRHDEDYLHVWLEDREYLLTQTQAGVVRVLHEAAKSDSPWMHLEEIRHAVDFETPKLSQLFRRMDGWQDLIRSDRRGNYRLNL